MRANGVPNFPDPNGQGVIQGSGIDPNSAAFQKAQQTCAKDLGGGAGTRSPAQIAQAEAAALAFSKCMRSHGVPDFPDPQFGSGGGISIRISAHAGAGGNNGLDPNSPIFQKAQRTCGSLLPGRAGGKLGSVSTEAPGRSDGRSARSRSPARSGGGGGVACWRRPCCSWSRRRVVLVVTDPFSGAGGPSGGVQRQRVCDLDPGGGAGVDLAADAGERDARLRRGRDDPRAGRERAGGGDAGAAVGDDRSGDARRRAVDASSDSSALSQARATLAADQQQESVDCAGDNAAQAPSAGGGGSGGASGGCARGRAAGRERPAVGDGGCGEGVG